MAHMDADCCDRIYNDSSLCIIPSTNHDVDCMFSHPRKKWHSQSWPHSLSSHLHSLTPMPLTASFVPCVIRPHPPRKNAWNMAWCHHRITWYNTRQTCIVAMPTRIHYIGIHTSLVYCNPMISLYSHMCLLCEHTKEGLQSLSNAHVAPTRPPLVTSGDIKVSSILVTVVLCTITTSIGVCHTRYATMAASNHSYHEPCQHSRLWVWGHPCMRLWRR